MKYIAYAMARCATLFAATIAIKFGWDQSVTILIVAATAVTWGVTGYADCHGNKR